MLANANPDLEPKLRDIFLFDMAGCVVINFVINSPSTKYLIEYLGILG